jgi:DnaJ-class molecular chaperone
MNIHTSMNVSENLYTILGVSEDSTKEEIKRAYRSMQLKYHPDKNKNSTESVLLTQKINKAYEVLGNDEKKRTYDQERLGRNCGSHPFASGGGGGGNGCGGNGCGGAMNAQEMDEIFQMFFGDAFFSPPTGHPGPGGIHFFQPPTLSKPVPIVKNVEVHIKHILTGIKLPVEIERWVVENGVKMVETETIYVTIPQGMDDNELIVLREQGNCLHERNKGDIKLFVKIVNDTEFKRCGLDLIYDKTIGLKEALCGCIFTIKHINGKSYRLENAEGSILTPELKKTYNGLGLTRGEYKGDLVIHYHVEFPKIISKEQLEALKGIL